MVKDIPKINETKTYVLTKREIKRFAKPSNLIAFYELFEKDNKDECYNIIIANCDLITTIMGKQKDNVLCGFFAHLISKMDISKAEDEVKQKYFNLMFSFSKRKSVYCHENALQTFYVFGNADLIVKTYQYFTEKGITHNEKLLADGLLTFTGDKAELGKALLENKSSLSLHYQIATVNFLSMAKIHVFDKDLVQELTIDLDLDYRCAILRLLGKVKSPINREILLAALKDYSFSVHWQPAAVAANGLSLYVDDEEISEQLAKSCYSQHWSVRINSARSLIVVDRKRIYARKVFKDKDKYAQDAIKFAISKKEWNKYGIH